MPRDLFRLGYSICMQAESKDTAELKVYGRIVMDSPMWYRWGTEDQCAAEFDKAVKGVIKMGAKKVLLRINSPGGTFIEAVAMRSILANAGFEEINIRIEGLCASAATVIAAIPGAHVVITEGSEYMIHNPWLAIQGNANDLEHAVERLRNIEQTSRDFYMAKTGQSEEQIKEWMDAETWFTADQAVEYGFADEVMKADVNDASPAVACATHKEYIVMQSLYRSVPEQITVSNEVPVAGASTEIHLPHEEEEVMDLSNINIDQLREGNPALLDEIQQAAVAAERARLSDIDALTDPGYEDLAEQAKANGTPAMDFYKQLIAAKKQKGADFMAARTQETANAAQVVGGAPDGSAKTEEQEIEDFAKSVAEYANQYAPGGNDGMF